MKWILFTVVSARGPVELGSHLHRVDTSKCLRERALLGLVSSGGGPHRVDSWPHTGFVRGHCSSSLGVACIK